MAKDNEKPNIMISDGGRVSVLLGDLRVRFLAGVLENKPGHPWAGCAFVSFTDNEHPEGSPSAGIYFRDKEAIEYLIGFLTEFHNRLDSNFGSLAVNAENLPEEYLHRPLF